MLSSRRGSRRRRQLAGLRLRQKWLDYARALVDCVSLRKAAARTDIHLETPFRWRHRFLAAAKDKKAAAATGIVEVAQAHRFSLFTTGVHSNVETDKLRQTGDARPASGSDCEIRKMHPLFTQTASPN